MKNKVTKSLLAFLLLIPFRLPISILFIHFFQWILGVTTNEQIPNGILATNVVITKMVYNIAMSALFLYSIEMFSREKMGRKPMSGGYRANEEPCFWWTVPIGLLLIAFIVVDAISVYDIFYINKP